MKTSRSVRVIASPLSYPRLFVAIIAFSFMFATLPMPVRAASLTSAQLSSVVSLLQSFGVDQGTINQVSQLLGGTTQTAVPPQISTNSQNDSIVASLDSSSPNYALIAGASTGVVLGVFKLHATGENIKLTKVGLTLVSGHAADLVTLYIYSSSGQLLGTALFAGSNTNTVSTLTIPLVLPQNLDTQIIVKADIASIGVNQLGTAGDTVSLALNPSTTQGSGVSTGTSVTATGGVSATNGVRIFKSYPSVALVPLSAPLSGSDQALLRFSVTANSTGSIGISQFPFTISAQNGTSVSNLGLYGYSDPEYSQPISGQGTEGLIGGATSASAPINTRFFITPVLSTPVEVPAGQTYYFELRGSVSATSNPVSVATTLLGDSQIVGGFFQAGNSGFGNFQWSPNDQSIGDSQIVGGFFQAGNSGFGNFQWSPNDQSISTSLTNDWTNGFAVAGLSSNGIGQNLTGTPQSTATSTPGSLVFSVASSLAPQTLTPGSEQVTVARFTLDANQSGEDVRLARVRSLYTSSSPSVDPTNCQFYNDSTPLNTGTHVVNNPSNPAGTESYITFTFDNPLVVPKGTTMTLNLTCNIPSSAVGSFQWGTYLTDHGIKAPEFSATGVALGDTIIPTGPATAGTQMKIVPASVSDTLTISLDPASSSYSIVAGGSTGVTLGVFDLRASGENIALTKLGISLASGHAADLSEVYIYNSTTGAFLGTAQFANSTLTTAILTTPLTLSQNVTTEITLKADMATVGVNQPGTAGDLISVALNPSATQGVGISSGSFITGSGTATGSHGVRLFKSYPTVSLGSLPSIGLSDGNLLRFSISASVTGSVGIIQFPFIVSVLSGERVSNLALYAYTDPADSQFISGEGNGGLIGSAMTTVPTNTRFFVVPANNQPIEIPAGQTYYFELRGSVSGNSNITSITTLLGDVSYNQLFQAGASANGNFQWSPNDQGTTAPLTSDWTNGYYVPGLPASGISQTRTGSGATSTASAMIIPIATPTSPNVDLLSAVAKSVQAPITMLADALGNVFFTLGIY
jgi:hypothetical protein